MNWFKHDINCQQDDRLAALIDAYGAEGYAVFYSIIEKLYANDGKPIGSLALKKIAFNLKIDVKKVLDIAIYAASDDCENLLIKDGKDYKSERVIHAIQEQENLVNLKKERARKASLARWNTNEKQSNASAMQMQSISITDGLQTECKSNASAMQNDAKDKNRLDKRREDEIRGDKIELSCSNEQSNSLKGSSFHSEPTISPETRNSLQASGEDDGSVEVVFEELPVLGGGTFKVSESQVDKWQESFPAINVKEQIKMAHSWLDANPKNQKRDVKRFLNNWLMRNQDRARANSKAPVQETIKGTNIPMTLRANGGDPSHFANDHKYDDFFDPISKSKKTEVAK